MTEDWEQMNQLVGEIQDLVSFWEFDGSEGWTVELKKITQDLVV